MISLSTKVHPDFCTFFFFFYQTHVADTRQTWRPCSPLKSHSSTHHNCRRSLQSVCTELFCCLIFTGIPYHNLRTHKDICLKSFSKTHSSRHVGAPSTGGLVVGGADYGLILRHVGRSSRSSASTCRTTLWKTRLSPDSAPALQRQHCFAAAQRVTWAQPSARIQGLIYCPITWPQRSTKLAVNITLWKGGESVCLWNRLFS